MMRSNRSRVQRGFTLVEVLVALGVLALVMPALLLVLRQRADSVAYLRDQTMSQWVAANRLAELRLYGLDNDETSGLSEMAGRSWRWQVKRQDTGVDGFLRIDISVRIEHEDAALSSGTGEAALSNLTGFIRLGGASTLAPGG